MDDNKPEVFVEDLANGARREGTRLRCVVNHGPAVLYWPLGIIVDEVWERGKLSKRSVRDWSAILVKVKIEGHRPAVKAELEKLVGELDTVMLVNVKMPGWLGTGTFIGHMKDNKYHGKFVFVNDNGYALTGNCTDGKLHGGVVEYCTDGSICDNIYEHGKYKSRTTRR